MTNEMTRNEDVYEARFTTRSVLGGAYKGKRASLKAMLTHLSDSELDGGETAVCGKVKAGNLGDAHGHTEAELLARPTCPACARKWDALNAK